MRDKQTSIFDPLFESKYDYLCLLNLGGEDAVRAVQLVRACCRSVADPYPDINHWLDDPNWRVHLVAAVAAILQGPDPETVRRLWHRFDAGSWVTPQLAATLFLVDSDLERQSRTRLEAGCPVDVSELRAMSPLFVTWRPVRPERRGDRRRLPLPWSACWR